jgi:predicted Fe-Mo cluster-binding NifX family protein
MGPRAQDLFAQNRIETLIGVQGSIDTIIAQFLQQELEVGEDLCGHPHGHGECEDHQSDQPGESQNKGPRIFITASGKDLDAEVDPRFGRAQNFLIVDPETWEFETFENPNKDVAQGAGIQSAQFAAKQDISAVITGRCGPKAESVLNSSGVRIVTGASGKVKDAIHRYLKGTS